MSETVTFEGWSPSEAAEIWEASRQCVEELLAPVTPKEGDSH